MPQVNGESGYCSDCQQTTPCLGGGSGAWATLLNGSWQCGQVLSPALVTPVCAQPTGSTASIAITPTQMGFPITECLNWVLGVNGTLTSAITSISNRPSAGWGFHAFIRQPLIGGPKTFTLTSGSPGVFVFTSGCPSLPSMPTGANHGLDIAMVYDSATQSLNIEACNTTGN